MYGLEASPLPETLNAVLLEPGKPSDIDASWFGKTEHENSMSATKQDTSRSPACSSARCGSAQERLAAKKAAKREKARQMRRRLAKARREAAAEAKRMQKAKKKRRFAQRVRR